MRVATVLALVAVSVVCAGRVDSADHNEKGSVSSSHKNAIGDHANDDLAAALRPLALTRLPEDVRGLVVAHLSPQDLANAASVDHGHRQLLARADHWAQRQRRAERDSDRSDVNSLALRAAGDSWLRALREAIPRFMTNRWWSVTSKDASAKRFRLLAEHGLRGLSAVELNRLAVQCIAAQWSGCFQVLVDVDGERIAPEVRAWKESWQVFRTAGRTFLARVEAMEIADHARLALALDRHQSDGNSFRHARHMAAFQQELAGEYLLDFDENNFVNALSRTIHRGKSVAVARALIRCGANPRHSNYHGNTPLHHAAAVSSMRFLFRDLLIAGADLEARNMHDETPLAVAASLGLEENVALLLDLGAADIQHAFIRAIEARQFPTATQLFKRAHIDADLRGGAYAFRLRDYARWAIDMNDMAVLRYLLLLDVVCDDLDGMVDVNRQGPPTTLLVHAVQRGSMPAVELLLNAGASPRARGKDGRSAVELVMDGLNVRMAERLQNGRG